MSEKGQEIYALSQYLIDEIINAAGLKKSVWTHRFLDFLLRNVTTHLATICVITDQKIASDGFPAATGWMASHWIRQVSTRGAETSGDSCGSGSGLDSSTVKSRFGAAPTTCPDELTEIEMVLLISKSSKVRMPLVFGV